MGATKCHFHKSVGLVTVGKDLRTLLLLGFLCNEPRLLAHADATAPGGRGSLLWASAAPAAPPGRCEGLAVGGGASAESAAASPAAAVVAAAAAVTWEPL